MFKFFYIVLLFIILTPSSFALTHKPAIIIGDHVITEYELDQKIRFMMFMQEIDIKENKPSAFYGYFLNTIIDNYLVVFRIKQTGAVINKDDVTNGLEYVSNSKNTTPKLFVANAKKNGIDTEYLMDFIADDIMMQIMFLGPLTKDIIISDDDIKKESMKNDKNMSIETIKNNLIQKEISQKAKQFIQTLRQATLIEIKIK